MNRQRRRVYRCPDCRGETHSLSDALYRGPVRDHPRYQEAEARGPVKILSVLCWWCRTFHPPEEVEECMKIPERRVGLENGTGSLSSALVAGPLTPLSELWAFLTATALEGGKKRLTGKLSLSCESGMLAATLNDPSTGQYCCLEGHDLAELLTKLDDGLQTGFLPWRASKYLPKGKK